MRTVLGYLRPYWRRVACGVTIKFTAAVQELILPLLLAHIIDDLVPAGDPGAIWKMGGVMALLAFGAALCNITANRMAAWVSMEMTRSLRRDLYSCTEYLSCAQMDKLSVSSLVSRLTNDTYHCLLYTSMGECLSLQQNAHFRQRRPGPRISGLVRAGERVQVDALRQIGQGLGVGLKAAAQELADLVAVGQLKRAGELSVDGVLHDHIQHLSLIHI